MPPAVAPALLVAAVMLWSGNFVVGRVLGDDVSAVGLNFWRWAIALVILLPLALPEMRRHRAAITESWLYLALLGVTGVAAFHVFVYKAVTHTAATNALLVLSTAPAVIMLLSRLALGEAIRSRQWIGIAVSLAGAVVLISHGDLEALRALRLGRGELWMLAAVPTWSVYVVLLKRRPAALPQRSTLTISTAFGLAWLAPAVMASPGSLVIDWSPVVAAGVAYISIGASVVAFLCWNQGVALVGPPRAGAYLHLMPLFGALLAFVLLGESLQAYHGVGAALVFTGIVLTQRHDGGVLAPILRRLSGGVAR